MGKDTHWKKIIMGLAILVLYIIAVARGMTEINRRTLRLEDQTSAPNHLLVSALVTNVNPVTQELSAQLDFRLFGDIGRDEVSPSSDLKLLINNVGGEQEFDFKKGERMNPIQVVFPLNGNLNRYPFDKYETTLWLLITKPSLNKASKAPEIPEGKIEEPIQSDELKVGTVALQHRSPVPVSLVLSAAIPGIKFGGRVTRNATTEMMGIKLKLRRADNLILTSILVNIMMIALAMSVLSLALRGVDSSNGLDLLPLSLSITLIFGLPALRNVQPGVPPIGAVCDYISFIWAEMIVATSALIVTWAWILRNPRSNLPTVGPDSSGQVK